MSNLRGERSRFENLKRDFFFILRIVPILGFAAIFLVDDKSASVLTYVIAITLVLIALSHIVRKLLFPYIDLRDAWEKANDTPVGAAIVFASICYLMSTFINISTALWLR